MEPRSGVRSSARLSGGGGGGGGGAAPPAPAGPGRRAAPAAAAEAARRRARAAERAREVEDSPRELRAKCRRLARALREAKHLVVYTGAGISTAADIPDYRGPRGVWTRLQRGETVGRVEVSAARPTFTHMALTALWARGTLKFVASQNCDGLHVRAGLPRRALAELHGDMFCELCAACRRVYVRAFDTTERTARHAHGTRRLCHACGAELRDSIVHFGERGRAAWPLNWAGALRHAARADVVLCLGSSLKVLRRYPRLWRMHAPPRSRPALYIVNLQWTPKDAAAALKINARCDAVMRQVARRLRLRVPRYRPAADPLLAHAEPLAPPEVHTTRRPLLRAPLHHHDHDRSDPSDDDDSDEELPLRRLAERLRAPPPPPPPPAPPPPPPGLLRAFRVNMRSGEVTILLKAEHAPSPFLPPAPAVVPAAPGPPAAAPVLAPALVPGPGRALSELRLFRMRRPAVLNGHAARRPADDAPDIEPDIKADVKLEVKVKKEEEEEERPASWAFGSSLRRLLKDPAGAAAAGAAAGAAWPADALAAAYIARAVLVCRASLYPGLHTIVGGAGAGAAEAECGWCLRRHGARRCLWYGPPRLTPPAARAARRRGPARLLCACCDGARRPGAPPAPPADGRDDDGGGWFGKGYRKGRRRR